MRTGVSTARPDHCAPAVKLATLTHDSTIRPQTRKAAGYTGGECLTRARSGAVRAARSGQQRDYDLRLRLRRRLEYVSDFDWSQHSVRRWRVTPSGGCARERKIIPPSASTRKNYIGGAQRCAFGLNAASRRLRRRDSTRPSENARAAVFRDGHGGGARVLADALVFGLSDTKANDMISRDAGRKWWTAAWCHGGSVARRRARSPVGGNAARAGDDDDDAGNRAAALRRPTRDVRGHAASATGARPSPPLALPVAEGVTMPPVRTPAWRPAHWGEGAGVSH